MSARSRARVSRRPKKSAEPVDEKTSPATDASGLLETDTWQTFTCRLPFTLGLKDPAGVHRLWLSDAEPESGSWNKSGVLAELESLPVVRLRFHQIAIGGVEVLPEFANAALQAFYPDSPLDEGEELPLWAPGAAYEQWVTMETQNNRWSTEPKEDEGFAFHRCLTGLNNFLASYIYAFGNTNVQLVNTPDLGRLVLRGALDDHGSWRSLGPLMMHPEFYPQFLPDVDMQENGPRLRNALVAVTGQMPYVQSKLWYWRAHAALSSGDQVNLVVSLQTSIESMLYATWRMILVDQRKTSEEIDDLLAGDNPYKSLVTRILPPLLGGQWSLTAKGTPLAIYWHDLYELRNRIVHAARVPSVAEGEAAFAAYRGLRSFLNERVWARRAQYPRTVLAKIGQPEAFGWKSGKFEAIANAIGTETPLWWLPQDVVGWTV